MILVVNVGPFLFLVFSTSSAMTENPSGVPQVTYKNYDREKGSYPSRTVARDLSATIIDHTTGKWPFLLYSP